MSRRTGSAKIALIRVRTEVACDRLDAVAVQAADLVAKYAQSFPASFSNRRDRRIGDRDGAIGIQRNH